MKEGFEMNKNENFKKFCKFSENASNFQIAKSTFHYLHVDPCPNFGIQYMRLHTPFKFEYFSREQVRGRILYAIREVLQ